MAWLRWNHHDRGRHCWFETRPNCPHASDTGEACVLFLHHSGLHSWTATHSEAQ
ncbi:hypothetical protein [Streptomyces sp. NPDC014733]|uniref:hypothetical protein n=1 Tax=Streptomyces sp. NPDC014733 TaxID=3364885 RepID=UPI0036FA4E66